MHQNFLSNSSNNRPPEAYPSDLNTLEKMTPQSKVSRGSSHEHLKSMDLRGSEHMRTVDLRHHRDVSVQQIGVNRGIQILTGNKSSVYSGSEHSRSRSTGGTG